MKWIIDFTKLSKISTRFQTLAQGFSFLLQNTPVMLRFTAGFLLLHSVKAGQCAELSGSYSTVYLNSTQDNGLLAIKYNSVHYDLPVLDNVCNLTLAEKPSGSYPELECLCMDSTEGPVRPKSNNMTTEQKGYKVIVSGQNMGTVAMNCIREILEANCNKVTPSQLNGLIVFGVFFGVACCGISFREYYKRDKRCGRGESNVTPLLEMKSIQSDFMLQESHTSLLLNRVKYKGIETNERRERQEIRGAENRLSNEPDESTSEVQSSEKDSPTLPFFSTSRYQGSTTAEAKEFFFK